MGGAIIERRTAQFRVPFKVPFSSAAGPQVSPNSNVVLGDTISDAPETSPVSKDAPMEAPLQSPEDDIEVLSCKSGRCWSRCMLSNDATLPHLINIASPFSLPADEIDLDAPFSQKIPVRVLLI
jgi:hypothetical protein